MSDVLWLYCVIAYLFQIGVIIGKIDTLLGPHRNLNLIILVLSPVALPITIGRNYSIVVDMINKHNKGDGL